MEFKGHPIIYFALIISSIVTFRGVQRNSKGGANIDKIGVFFCVKYLTKCPKRGGGKGPPPPPTSVHLWLLGICLFLSSFCKGNNSL